MKLTISVCFLGLLCAVSKADNDVWPQDKPENREYFEHIHDKDVLDKNYLEDVAAFEAENAKFAEHNAKFAEGKVSFSVGPNAYSHLPKALAKTFLFGYHEDKNAPPSRHMKNLNSLLRQSDNTPIPESVNWVEKNIVTFPKDQKTCASGYAFAVVGALEAAYCKITGSGPTSLSAQNIVDCSVSFGNEGCNGGDLAKTFEFIIENQGIDSEVNYLYTGEEQTCKEDDFRLIPITSFVNVSSEEELLRAVAIGPVAVGVNAFPDTFMNYKTGIYDDAECADGEINHAVLVVGYGTENDKPYWLIKNSWGISWGTGGCMKIARNQNQCSIGKVGFYPISNWDGISTRKS